MLIVEATEGQEITAGGTRLVCPRAGSWGINFRREDGTPELIPVRLGDDRFAIASCLTCGRLVDLATLRCLCGGRARVGEA